MRFNSCVHIFLGWISCAVAERDVRMREGILTKSALHDARETGHHKKGENFDTFKLGQRKKNQNFDVRAAQMKSALHDMDNIGHHKMGDNSDTHKTGKRQTTKNFDTRAVQRKSGPRDAHNASHRKIRNNFGGKKIHKTGAWDGEQDLLEYLSATWTGYAHVTACDDAAQQMWGALFGTGPLDDHDTAQAGGALLTAHSPERTEEGVWIGHFGVDEGRDPVEKDFETFLEDITTDPDKFNRDEYQIDIRDSLHISLCDGPLIDYEIVELMRGQNQEPVCGCANWQKFRQKFTNLPGVLATWSEYQGEVSHWFVVVNKHNGDLESLLLQAIGIRDVDLKTSVHDWFTHQSKWNHLGLGQEVYDFGEWVETEKLWEVFKSGRVPGVPPKDRAGTITVVMGIEKPWA